MIHIANIRLGLVEFLLLVGGALTWTSCINDNIDYDMDYDEGYDVVDNEVEKVSVRLNISAGQSGGISVSRADDYEGSYKDDNARNGEYMNTLCVFVVDASGVIVKKLTPATSEDGWEGTWPEWTSEDELTLPTGTYTVYAFSNWETVYDEENPDSDNNKWATIIERTADGTTTLTDEDLNIDIDDPASKVDLTNDDESLRKYIPMSGSEKITVTQDGESFNVSMDRLVGRVEVTIYGESGTGAADITLNSFTFGDCADKVPLMNNVTAATTITYDKKYEIDLDGKVIEAVAEGDPNEETFYFYVNETYRSNATDVAGGFNISLVAGSNGYGATTATTDIPRNNIYPIALTLDNYELDLVTTAMTSILGYEGELDYDTPITVDDNTYYITMLDVTSTFTITPSLTSKNGSDPTGVEWTWKYVGVTEDNDGNTTTTETEIGVEAEDGATPACTVDGEGVLTVTALTATSGYEYNFTLEAEWTESSGDNSVTHTRTYSVTVVFNEGFPVFQASRAWWTRSYGSELLRLRVCR